MCASSDRFENIPPARCRFALSTRNDIVCKIPAPSHRNTEFLFILYVYKRLMSRTIEAARTWMMVGTLEIAYSGNNKIEIYYTRTTAQAHMLLLHTYTKYSKFIIIQIFISVLFFVFFFRLGISSRLFSTRQPFSQSADLKMIYGGQMNWQYFKRWNIINFR